MPRRALLTLTLSLLFSVLGIGLVVALTGQWDGLAQLGSLSAAALLMSLGLLALHYLAGGARLALLARVGGAHVSLWSGTRAFILGLFCAMLTPSGGGNAPAIALALRQGGVPGSLALAFALYTSVLDLLFFAWGVPVAALLLAANDLLPAPLLWLSVLLTPLCFALWYGLSFELKRFKRTLLWLFTLPYLKRWRRRAGRFLDQLDETAQLTARQPLPQQLSLQLATATLHLALYAIFFVVAHDLGLDLMLPSTLALLLLVSVGSYAVPTPGGGGYLEVALGFALAARGEDTPVAPALLAWRVLAFYLSVGVGALLGGGLMVREIGARSGGTSRV